MKTMKLMKFLPAVLLGAMVFFLPAFAQNAGTLKVPSDDGETNVKVLSVYAAGPNAPGVRIKGENQPVSATIEGDVDALYGGADMETIGSGQVTLVAGRIRGGFGVLAYINGGQIVGTVNTIEASADTALEAILSKSGSLKFNAFLISSNADAVTVETGADFSGHIVDSGIIDDPEAPGEDGWDVIDDEGTGESGGSGENGPAGISLPESLPLNDPDMAGKSLLSESVTAKAGGGSGDVVITSQIIEAGGTAVDIMLHDASKVSITSDEITSEDSAVLIKLSEEGGDVSLKASTIDTYNQGIMITAPKGKVTVKNEDSLSAKSAADVYNDGADVTLDTGFIFASSGLFVESTSGKTVEKTKDIVAENYGIHVRTHEAVEAQPFGPDAAASEQGSTGSSAGAPSVQITVNGDISDDFEYFEKSEDAYTFSSAGSEEKGIAKDGGAEPGNGSAEVSAGIIAEADTAGTIDISVRGEIFMPYGNQIDADNGADVTVSVRDDVITTYGNRFSADNARVAFSVGKSIMAGGKALDTLASANGKLDITIGEGIFVSDSVNEDVTAGIYANSMENGSTKIKVKDGISAHDENGKTPVYGIYAENTGGQITITAGDDVTADGNDSIGAVIINGSDSIFSEIGNGSVAPDVTTAVDIRGNLTGKSTGLYVYGSESTWADVFVEDTISGDDAGVEISDEVTPENLDLKVWRIILKSGKAVIGGIFAEEVEDHVNYLIRYVSDDLKEHLEAVDENGVLLPFANGYQYAEDGVKIYFRVVSGDISALYNVGTALTKEADGRFSLVIPTGGGIMISADLMEPPDTSDDLSWLCGCKLPGTGFPANHVTTLAARPRGLNYIKTGLTLLIPGLDVEEEIVKVPETDGSYRIEWLDSSIGLLEHSSLPGKGIAVLTGHNHLNSTEAGPFLFIGKMEAGDRIMIRDARNSSKIYRVYGNYKVASDGFASIADELRENALVLITCEDESLEGGFVNRRIVLAEPLG